MAYQEPEFLPWDGRRVPITFIGGYLGAGKTTAINELLAESDRPIAVLVNDIGEVNIDARLIKRRHGDTLELTDGCVCCSLIDGFGAAFDQIRARAEPPDHVVVELSGVANPERMIPWGDSAGFVLDGIVIVVAADQIAQIAVSGPNDRVAQAIEQQVTHADVLVLTKTDIVERAVAQAAMSRLRQLAPDTPVFTPTDLSSTGRFLSLGGRRPEGVGATPAPSLFDAHVTRSTPLPVFDVSTGFDAIHERLDAEVAQSAETIVRMKGVAATTEGGLVLIQVVGARREITPLPTPEWQAPTDLTVISVR